MQRKIIMALCGSMTFTQVCAEMSAGVLPVQGQHKLEDCHRLVEVQVD